MEPPPFDSAVGRFLAEARTAHAQDAHQATTSALRKALEARKVELAAASPASGGSLDPLSWGLLSQAAASQAAFLGVVDLERHMHAAAPHLSLAAPLACDGVPADVVEALAAAPGTAWLAAAMAGDTDDSDTESEDGLGSVPASPAAAPPPLATLLSGPSTVDPSPPPRVPPPGPPESQLSVAPTPWAAAPGAPASAPPPPPAHVVVEAPVEIPDPTPDPTQETQGPWCAPQPTGPTTVAPVAGQRDPDAAGAAKVQKLLTTFAGFEDAPAPRPGAAARPGVYPPAPPSQPARPPDPYSTPYPSQAGGPAAGAFQRGPGAAPPPSAMPAAAAAAAVGGGEGFITAAERMDRDVKSGRLAGISGAGNVRRMGLRRQGFAPPFAKRDEEQRQAETPPPAAPGSAPPAPAPVATAGIDRIASAVVAPHGPQAQGKEPKDGEVDEDFPAALLLPDGTVPPKLQNLEPKLVAQVASEIVDGGPGVEWDDIAGLEHAKGAVEEAIVWPLRRPDLFYGLRDPPRGLLLFGPPGTGKTMIARAIASRAECTFLNISASSLMSKWVGEGEKLVRCLFAVASVKQPAVVFIDEVDSLLSMRGEGETDAVRRVKTEFLVQLDGVGTDAHDRILVIGATNRPDELDEAARRRLEKRLYIPLPDFGARRVLLQRLVQDFRHAITDADFDRIAEKADGFSGADCKQLAREAAMRPLREQRGALASVNAETLRGVSRHDFMAALKRSRPSVGQGELTRYEEWNKLFGSFQLDGTADSCSSDDAD